MNYSKINYNDIANGVGLRITLFVSGCRNYCEGCFNPETWDFKYGKEFTPDILEEIIDSGFKPYIAGLTILGGEPMEPENIKDVCDLITHFKLVHPDKTVWLYSGYLYEDLISKGGDYKRCLDFADVLVDGKFELCNKDLNLKYSGSSNQRVINLAITRATGEIALINNRV